MSFQNRSGVQIAAKVWGVEGLLFLHCDSRAALTKIFSF